MPCRSRWARRPSAVLDADDALVVDVCAIRALRGQPHEAVDPGILEERPIPAGIALPRDAPRGQVRQLHAEDRRLQRVEPEVAADQVVVILRLHPVVAQEPQPARQRLVSAGHQAAIPERAEVLAGKK